MPRLTSKKKSEKEQKTIFSYFSKVSIDSSSKNDKSQLNQQKPKLEDPVIQLSSEDNLSASSRSVDIKSKDAKLRKNSALSLSRPQSESKNHPKLNKTYDTANSPPRALAIDTGLLNDKKNPKKSVFKTSSTKRKVEETLCDSPDFIPPTPEHIPKKNALKSRRKCSFSIDINTPEKKKKLGESDDDILASLLDSPREENMFRSNNERKISVQPRDLINDQNVERLIPTKTLTEIDENILEKNSSKAINFPKLPSALTATDDDNILQDILQSLSPVKSVSRKVKLLNPLSKAHQATPEVKKNVKHNICNATANKLRTESSNLVKSKSDSPTCDDSANRPCKYKPLNIQFSKPGTDKDSYQIKTTATVSNGSSYSGESPKENYIQYHGKSEEHIHSVESSIKNNRHKSSYVRREVKASEIESKNKMSESVEEKTDKICTELISNIHLDEFSDSFDAAVLLSCSLALDVAKRCVVTDVEPRRTEVIISVMCPESEAKTSCALRGSWVNCSVASGNIISLEAAHFNGSWIVDDKQGFIVLFPDLLISGTSIVGSIFCARRTVLSTLYRGMDSDSDIMVIGSLIHQLFETSLQQKVDTQEEVRHIADKLLRKRDVLQMLYGSGASLPHICKEIYDFVPKIASFISNYVAIPGDYGGFLQKKPSCTSKQISNFKRQFNNSNDWKGKIIGIHDIEETFWDPTLGIKGVVDVTVEVEDAAMPNQRKLMPLELKTGKSSFSAEHKGQVSLYTMMMSRRDVSVKSGLLLYLRDNSLREVPVPNNERKDLILLRNDLARYLNNQEPDYDTELHSFKPLELPQPIHFANACKKCPYLTLCSVHLKQNGLSELSEKHPMVELSSQSTKHLSDDHVSYAMHWLGLLQLEDVERLNSSNLRDIWCVPPREREKQGKALVYLQIQNKFEETNDNMVYTLTRKSGTETDGLSDDLRKSGLSAGDFVVVSTNTRLAVVQCKILSISSGFVSIITNKDLSKRHGQEVFHLDLCNSSTSFVFNTSNLGCLLDDTAAAHRLRRVVIDRISPSFNRDVQSNVLEESSGILSELNNGQRHALCRIFKAEQYALMKGLPGTGKTATVVALIQILVQDGQSILITSHTHAAVDNVLLRLKAFGMDFLRLGTDIRIHPELVEFSENSKTRNCKTPEEIEKVMNSQQVVAVTCLGASHALLTRRVFDICLIDESTQILQPSVLRPLLSAKRFVLIGDPEQLPPVVRSRRAQELGLSESLFARLDSSMATVSLNVNYRMNRVITALANGVTYEGALSCGNTAVANATLLVQKMQIYSEQWLSKVMSVNLEDSVIFVDNSSYSLTSEDYVDRENKSCTNVQDLEIVMQILYALIQSGIAGREIGVMAPYRAQVSLLARTVGQSVELTGVEVNTVDQFQGRDKQVVIYSCTRSTKSLDFQPLEQEILNDHRRLTVAITRAKHKLVLIGDPSTLKLYAPFQKLFQCLSEKHIVRVL